METTGRPILHRVDFDERGFPLRRERDMREETPQQPVKNHIQDFISDHTINDLSPYLMEDDGALKLMRDAFMVEYETVDADRNTVVRKWAWSIQKAYHYVMDGKARESVLYDALNEKNGVVKRLQSRLIEQRNSEDKEKNTLKNDNRRLVADNEGLRREHDTLAKLVVEANTKNEKAMAYISQQTQIINQRDTLISELRIALTRKPAAKDDDEEPRTPLEGIAQKSEVYNGLRTKGKLTAEEIHTLSKATTTLRATRYKIDNAVENKKLKVNKDDYPLTYSLPNDNEH